MKADRATFFAFLYVNERLNSKNIDAIKKPIIDRIMNTI